MPNQQAIIENIRKLESMGLHGEELIAQLSNLGIPRPQAERWIREAHGGREVTPAPSPSPSTNGFFAEKNMGSPTKANPNQAPAPAHAYASTLAPPGIESSTQTIAAEKLWEKGILTIVDTKLAQMERLKKEIDDVIEQHVNQHYDAMEKKLETLFEAQRELYKFKMDAQLNAKSNEVEEMLNQKINEIKTINLSTQEDLQRIKGQKMVVDDLLNELKEKTSVVEETKKAILHETGTKLEELQEKVDELVTTTETRVKEVEARATKTLELEEKITSGLAEQMQEQANKILDERVKDLRMEIKKEVIELKKMGADLASKDIQTIIQEFEDMNEKMEKAKKDMDTLTEQKTREMDKLIGIKMLEIDKIVNTKMETIVNQKEQTFFKKIEDQATDVNAIKRELAQKLLETETRLQNLDGFQKQFLENIRKNNLEKEDQAKLFKNKLDSFTVKTDDKISIVDQRLKQLDAVIGELAQMLTQLKNTQATAPTPGPAPNPNPNLPKNETKKGLFGK